MADNLEFRKKQREKKAAAEVAGGTYSQPKGSIGWQQTQATTAVQAGDVTGGGMSPGFAAKLAEAKGQPQAQQPGFQTTKSGSWIQDAKDWWHRQTTPEEGQDVFSPEKAMEAARAVAIAGTIAAGGYALMTALGLGTATVGGLKVTAKTAALYKTTGVATGTMAANPATTGLIGTAIKNAGIIKWGFALYLIKEAQEDIVFGKFQLVEGLDKLGIAYSRLSDLGMEESDEGLAVREAMDRYPEMMKWYRMNIPILGSKIGTDANIEAAALSRDAWDLINLVKKESKESGADEWTTYLTKKDEIEDQNLKDWEDANQIIIQAKAEARREGDREAIAMWETHGKEMIRLKEESAKRMHALWMEYLRLKFKLQEDRGRSQLGFGLLG